MQNSSNIFKNKRVLNEEEYVDALGKIIERDFFPDTKKLRDYLNANNNTSHDADNDTSLENEENISVDGFFKKYISEDNKSFEIIHAKDIEQHRQKFHWMYEPIENNMSPGMLMLYYQNGKALTVEDRANMDALLNSSAIEYSHEDTRPAAPNTWKFRVRNQLMFPPELATSEDICRVVNRSDGSGNQLSITDSDKEDTNPRVKLIADAEKMRPPKEIVHSNTRFAVPVGRPNQSHVIELPHTPSVSSEMGDYLDPESNSISHSRISKKYDPVTMTPSPMPGALGDDGTQVFMTWGEIAATPLAIGPCRDPLDIARNNKASIEALLDRAGIDATPLADRFEIKDSSAREKVARELHSKALLKIKKHRKESTNRPNSSRGNSSELTSLTPAAQALATRLLGVRSTPLQTSYHQSSTPKSSSRLAIPKSSSAASKSTSSSSKIITDGLLNI
jgi:hypothetical protein